MRKRRDRSRIPHSQNVFSHTEENADAEKTSDGGNNLQFFHAKQASQNAKDGANGEQYPGALRLRKPLGIQAVMKVRPIRRKRTPSSEDTAKNRGEHLGQGTQYLSRTHKSKFKMSFSRRLCGI